VRCTVLNIVFATTSAGRLRSKQQTNLSYALGRCPRPHTPIQPRTAAHARKHVHARSHAHAPHTPTRPQTPARCKRPQVLCRHARKAVPHHGACLASLPIVKLRSPTLQVARLDGAAHARARSLSRLTPTFCGTVRRALQQCSAYFSYVRRIGGVMLFMSYRFWMIVILSDAVSFPL